MKNNLTEEQEIIEFLKTKPDDKVLEWFGTDSQGVPNYLHFLNLMWSPKGVDHDIQLCREISLRLANEPDYLSEIIRTQFWRHTLVGCISVILLKATQYCPDLQESFNKPNFVSPQIAVALGLLCPTETISFLKKILQDINDESNPKKIASAYSVLAKIAPKEAIKFESSSILQKNLKHQDGEIAIQVVEEHWKFWNSLERKSFWAKISSYLPFNKHQM